MKRTTLCYIQKENSFLLLYRNKKKQDPNACKWIGIGGHIEEGETPDQCIVREVKEETGLTLTYYYSCGIVHFKSEMWEDEDMYLYLADGYEGELIEECDEGELRFVEKSEIPALPMWEGDTYFLKALLEGRRDINMTLIYKGKGDGEHLEEVFDGEKRIK